MISRRLVRIKVLQIYYAHLKDSDKKIKESERDLMKSIQKSVDLYYMTLLLIPELKNIAERRIDIARNKLIPTESDLNPNMRFVENPVIAKIEHSPAFVKYLKDNLIEWDNEDILNYFYNKLIKSTLYAKYMEGATPTFAKHRDFILNLMTEIVLSDENFYQSLEEKSLYWNDDFEYVYPQMLKMLRSIREEEEIEFPTPFGKEEPEWEFARTLLEKTIEERESYGEIIEKYTENWNIERMSEMDRLIMDMAITEWLHFPEIPIKVTINEYLEIAKNYSSEKSNAFINGILDKVLTDLNSSGRIQKKGRGLVE